MLKEREMLSARCEAILESMSYVSIVNIDGMVHCLFSSWANDNMQI